MNTPTDIANYALGPVLGVGRVTSLDDGTEEAAACKQWYPTALDLVVKAGRFPETIRRAQLTPFGAPVSGYAYSYETPNDWLQTIGAVVAPHGHVLDDPPWLLEGNLIYSNIKDLVIVYKFRPSNIGALPDSLCEAIGARLGALVALQLTGDGSKKAMAEQLAAAAFSQAQAEANRQRPAKKPSRPWAAPHHLGIGRGL